MEDCSSPGMEEGLLKIQEELDAAYSEYARRDFDLKYSHHQSIEDKLLARNQIVSEQQAQGKLLDFYERAFCNYDVSTELLPLDSESNPDARWIRSLVARYEKDYSIYVEITLNTNKYLANERIFKRVNLETDKSEGSRLDWKERVSAPIFSYFGGDGEETMVFDMLYEIYVDAVFFYFQENDRSN